MTIDNTGHSRTVILTKRYAIKIPSLLSYKGFLRGLLGNMCEVTWWKLTEAQKCLCPIKFYIPGGWLVVMPRLEIVDDEYFSKLDDMEYALLVSFNSNYQIPAERKANSWGWYKGKCVAIDYADYVN